MISSLWPSRDVSPGVVAAFGRGREIEWWRGRTGRRGEPHRARAEPVPQYVDRMLDPPRTAGLAIEQSRRVGTAAVGKLAGADSNQPEAGSLIGFHKAATGYA